MDNLFQTELFALTLTVGVYLVSLWTYRKTKKKFLHPLLVSILVIIAILNMLHIDYATYKTGSHLIHFMLGPSVVALGYILFEQSRYLKGNIVSILSSVLVGSIVGIVSILLVGRVLGVTDVLIATVQPKSVTTPIAMAISAKAGGIPALTAVLVVAVGIFGSIIGPVILKYLCVESKIAKGLAMGSAAHGLGTATAIQMGAIEGAISGLAIGLMGIMTAICVPIINWLFHFF
ncbi:MAG: LrgB family protein [Bacteroidaceae bacterium]|nr:LrgB family protein [Bacteroidaceae bacterium]